MQPRFRNTLLVSTALACAASASHAAPVDLVTNGGFETGDFTGWTQVINGTQVISNANPKSGVFSANLSNPTPSANLLQQLNVGTGLLTAGQSVTVSFDYRGTALAGGVLFAELFSIDGVGGVTKSELLGGAPLFPDADPDIWKNFTINTTLGPDVTNGATLQLNAACGADANCESNYFLDNVSLIADVDVSAVPIPAAVWLFGSGLLGLISVARRKR